MIEGKKRIDISQEEIFEKLSPFDLFKFYMPWEFELNEPCRNPLVKSDENPSMVIGDKSDTGEVIYKCFNSPHKGDALHFVMSLFGITYKQALEKVAKDFSLVEGDKDAYKRITGAYKQPKSVKKNVLIQVKTKPFGEEHIKYLQEFHLSPNSLSFCKDTKCVAIGEWALNRAKMPLKTKEVAFAYNLTNEQGSWLKIYRPHRSKKEKWVSNIPFGMMHGVGNINGGCKIGILTKSIKEGAWISKYITPCVEVVQAEDYSAITEDNKKRLLQSCQELYISFDSDPRGVESCIELTKEMGCKYINPPKDLLQYKVSDWTDMCRYYNDPQPVIDFFKQKIKGI